VPLKAAIMNMLAIGSAYGVVVAIFQWGWLKGLFGVEHTAPIISFLPMMMFAILFGLSMDYEVFILSRVREEWLRTGDTTQSVVDGISHTARVISSGRSCSATTRSSRCSGSVSRSPCWSTPRSSAWCSSPRP
jgi:RND superfamily putative drug exporter